MEGSSQNRRPNGTSRPHPGPLYADKFAGSPRQAPLCQLPDQIWGQTGLCLSSSTLLQSHGLDHGPCDAPPRRYDIWRKHPRFRLDANDIAAHEGDLADITMTLESIEAASYELGLHIFWAKTKVQNIGAGQLASNLLVNGQTVEVFFKPTSFFNRFQFSVHI